MNNPYTILNVKENSTKEEIEAAYIKKLKEYNFNENAKDKNGDYEIQKLIQARDELINLESRKRIDQELNYNREDYALVPIKENKKAKNIQINNEFVNGSITLKKKNIFDSKIKINKVYAVLDDNDYFTFASEKHYGNRMTSAFLYACLFDMYLKEEIFSVKYSECENDPYIPWNYPNTVLETNRHLEAIVYPGKKFVPLDLIDKNGCVYKDDLRAIILYVNEYLKNHKGEVKEQIDEMLKNNRIKRSNKLVGNDEVESFKIVNR